VKELDQYHLYIVVCTLSTEVHGKMKVVFT